MFKTIKYRFYLRTYIKMTGKLNFKVLSCNAVCKIPIPFIWSQITYFLATLFKALVNKNLMAMIVSVLRSPIWLITQGELYTLMIPVLLGVFLIWSFGFLSSSLFQDCYLSVYPVVRSFAYLLVYHTLVFHSVITY